MEALFFNKDDGVKARACLIKRNYKANAQF